MKKYRGKTKEGKWVYGWYWYNEATGKHYIRQTNFQPAEFDYTDYEVIEASLGQSTGRKDDEGAEIYQKDFIAFIGEDGSIHEVVYDDDVAAFALHNWDTTTHTFFYELRRDDAIEVIGNKTDNPNLLEENK